ncbi:MAG: hypothetical protein LIO56_05710, partial [Lachnospiraceae bacterium]|nr:hypothetical protein [Lachnospiraceae bacterium]
MKKITAILLSISLILPAGTVSVLADPAVDTLSVPVQDDADSNGSVEGDTALENGEATEEIPGETTENANADVSADAETSSEEESVNTDDPDSEELPTDETGEEVAEESSEEEQNEEEAAVTSLAAQTLSVEDYVDCVELDLEPLKYDDRYDLSDLSEDISSGEDYTICMDSSNQNITSYQVINGSKSSKLDEALITQIEEGSTKVAATGVGTGVFYLIRTDDLDTLKTLGVENDNIDKLNTQELEPNKSDTKSSGAGTLDTAALDEEVLDTVTLDEEVLDTATSDEEAYDAPLDEMALIAATSDEEEAVAAISEDDKIPVYEISVTVDKAPLTLMFLTGQSNMEGTYTNNSEYDPGASIACTDGAVYSTYVPSSESRGDNATGLSSISTDTTENVAGSLQGAVENTETAETSEGSTYLIGGTLTDPLNTSGNKLLYPLNSLTETGGGKTGPDSGLAYKWNKETQDKVWVINTAYNGANISGWIPNGTYYNRFAAVWKEVKNTYNAEMNNHYTDGSASAYGNKLVFWMQGETGDSSSSADKYESSFNSMYNAMCNELGSNVPFGIIMVRAGYVATDYTTSADLIMSGPRIAQYFLGSSNSSYKNVFVVSNVNEQWVTNSGVSSYFNSAYSGGLSYPMQSASKSLPTTVSAVHPNIHYTQVGHNENGITAADGMLKALGNASGSCKVSWKDKNANSITSVTMDSLNDAVTVVPVVDPVYLAKKVSYSISDKSVISYDYATGSLQSKAYGTSKITPSGGSGTLSVAVNGTDIVKINGVWTYTVNGKADYSYTGLAKNSNGWYYIKNGELDRTYTGFAKNENGSWYVTKGKLTRKDNSVLKDEKGAIGAQNEWYYVVGSKVQSDYTGLANYKNASGWWYI